MNKRIVVILFLFCVALSSLLSGCKKDKEECTIYGTVVSKEDGEPVANAKVEVGFATKTYDISITGSDGCYEVTFVPESEGLIDVCVYNSYGFSRGSECFSISYGQKIRCDFQIND